MSRFLAASSPSVRSASPILIAALLFGACGGGGESQQQQVTPPPQASDYPNEPAGATKLTERSYGAQDEDGWTDGSADGAANASFVEQSDPSAPKSPPNIMVVTYKAGFLGGTQPINNFKSLSTPPGTMYVSFWVKFSPNWVGHPGSGVNKIFHIFIAGLNRVYLSAQGSNSGDLVPQIRLQQIASNSGFRNLEPNLATPAFTRGQWHRWEFLLTVNTAGNADGKADWWIDGTKVGSYSDIGYVTADQAHAWTSVNWAPTWGGTGSTVGSDQTMAIDHIYISGK